MIGTLALVLAAGSAGAGHAASPGVFVDGTVEEAAAQVAPPSDLLLDGNAAAAILNEISGVRAKRYVTRLTAYDRISASPGYHEAAEWLLAELDGAEILQTRLERYAPEDPQPLRKRPSLILPNWTVRGAELWTIEPVDSLIVNYAETPISLARYSRPARVTAELVDVGIGTRATDYEGVDVAGKVVLASGFSSTVERIAVGEHGAAGVVVAGGSSYDEWKGWGYPGMQTWQVLSPGPIDNREPSFAFSITEEQGEALRRQLRAGEHVVVTAIVDAVLSPGTQEIVTSVLPGSSSPDQEVLLLGHLDHVRPSANDNASGSGTLLEVALALDRLVASGRVAAPRRSIRFLWMTEGAGTYGFLNAHPSIGDRILAAINLDMVGEGRLPGTGPMNVHRPPDSLPSYFFDVVMNVIDHLDTLRLRAPTGSESLMNVRAKPFSANSDHYITSDGAVGIPTLLLNHGPDPFHHTNLDAPDAVDPTTLQRVGFIAAASAYLVASSDDRTAARIATHVLAAASRRLADAAAEGFGLIAKVSDADADEAYWLAERKLHHVGAREEGALGSVAELTSAAWPAGQAALNSATHPPADLAGVLRTQQAALGEALRLAFEQRTGRPLRARDLSTSEQLAATLVPRRTAPYLNERWVDEIDDELIGDDDREWLAGFKARLIQSYIRIPEMLNLLDGHRSLLDVRDALSAEDFDFMRPTFGVGSPRDLSLEYRRIDMDDILHLARIMERCGMLALEKPR